MTPPSSSFVTPDALSAAQIPAPAQDPYRLGAFPVPGGVDFAVLAAQASAVELCVFDGPTPVGKETRYLLRGPINGIWHGHLPGVGVGTRYGYRVSGQWAPQNGLRHNRTKLLLDPYARAIEGQVNLDSPTIYDHLVEADNYPVLPLCIAEDDSAPATVRGVVVAPSFPVLAGPRIPWNKTVIYEAHVRGLTMNLPGLPGELRGTYAGLAHPATISYLKDLGVTSIELLPIHAKCDEVFLAERGLSNYWGYSTLGFFAPEPSYATRSAQEAGGQAVLDEVRGMVSLLHEAGLEVILDVVYNHTCEGGTAGPTLSWRGLDSTGYYLPEEHHPGHFADMTGCGNTLDFGQPRVVQLTLDSLRYWASEVGVDGFRFDLAATLGRFGATFTKKHPFFMALAADPVLTKLKMIAEPWDLGPDGWQTGHFPVPFADWNDRFRSAVRQFWLADAGQLSQGYPASSPNELATRLAGSADLFAHGELPGGRGTHAAINYVTAHDGFTLADLVSYNHKRNELNLEENRDGTGDNRSWNHGIEGTVHHQPSTTGVSEEGMSIIDDVMPSRLRSMLNLFGTLLMAAGTPMITAGDEFGRTQMGNNNAYCQDNEVSWLDWELEDWQRNLHRLVRHLLRLRREHPVLRPDCFASGSISPGDQIPDLAWFDETGVTMPAHAWHDPTQRVLQSMRSGFLWGDVDGLLVVNGCLNPAQVKLAPGRGLPYELVFSSTWCTPERNNSPLPGVDGVVGTLINPGTEITMEPLSLHLYLTRPGSA